MAAEKRRGARRGASQVDLPSAKKGDDLPGENDSANAQPPLIRREKQTGTCPICGKPDKLDATPRPGGWLVGCWVCCPPDAPSPEKADYLAALAAAVGCRPYQIIKDAPRYLASYLIRHRRPHTERVRLSEGLVGGYVSALLVSAPALRWLIQGRGLTLETIERYELGYDQTRNAVTIPIRNTSGVLINLRRRFLDEDADPKIVGLARPACLYPLGVLADDPPSIAVCEGELDAMLMNQHGIPAITSTAGTHWAEDWNAYVIGRRVAVLYDAGGASYEVAERRADDFRRVGAKDAWPVDLTLAGFREGEDVSDWFTTYGWSAKELRAFANESRRWHRWERRTA